MMWNRKKGLQATQISLLEGCRSGAAGPYLICHRRMASYRLGLRFDRSFLPSTLYRAVASMPAFRADELSEIKSAALYLHQAKPCQPA